MRFKWIIIGLFVSQTLFAAVQIEHWQTSQGTPVYFAATPTLPMADIRVAFDAGSARDGEHFGLAALTSALIETGAGNLNADQIAEQFESVGAIFGSSVSEDIASLSLRTLSDTALRTPALELFKTVLSKPRFNGADFEREKKRALAGLQHREESPGAQASIAFSRALYGNHPYAHPEDGFVETVSPLKAADLKKFYEQYYVAANALVVIVGDMSRETAQQIAENLIAALPQGQKPQPIPEVAPPQAAHEQRIEFPSKQTHLLAGTLGTYRKDPDYFPLYVGNHILGGASLVSRLFDEVREKRGLAYSASTQLQPLFRRGPFVIGLQTRNDQTAQAEQVALDTVKNFIDNGPSDAELTAAKKNITGGFALRLDSNSKLTEYITMIGFYQMPLDYLDTFQARIDAVTAQDIKAAFNRMWDVQKLQVVTVGGK
jgi:zinc protease